MGSIRLRFFDGRWSHNSNDFSHHKGLKMLSILWSSHEKSDRGWHKLFAMAPSYHKRILKPKTAAGSTGKNFVLRSLPKYFWQSCSSNQVTNAKSMHNGPSGHVGTHKTQSTRSGGWHKNRYIIFERLRQRVCAEITSSTPKPPHLSRLLCCVVSSPDPCDEAFPHTCWFCCIAKALLRQST